jgi:hypothetical protein
VDGAGLPEERLGGEPFPDLDRHFFAGRAASLELLLGEHVRVVDGDLGIAIAGEAGLPLTAEDVTDVRLDREPLVDGRRIVGHGSEDGGGRLGDLGGCLRSSE